MVTVKLHIDDDVELKQIVRTHIKELALEILKTEAKTMMNELFKEKENQIKELAKTYFEKGYGRYANIRNDWNEEIKQQVQKYISTTEIQALMKTILIEKLTKMEIK